MIFGFIGAGGRLGPSTTSTPTGRPNPGCCAASRSAVTAALCCAPPSPAAPSGATGRCWPPPTRPASRSCLSEWGEGVPTSRPALVGSAVWAAAICLGVSRTGIWRLDRSTSHRLARAFVLTSLAAVVVCAVVAVQAGLPSVRKRDHRHRRRRRPGAGLGLRPRPLAHPLRRARLLRAPGPPARSRQRPCRTAPAGPAPGRSAPADLPQRR